MGVDLRAFWGLTPHDLAIIGRGYEIALKRQITSQNTMAHLQGAYFVEALMATVGNMFSDKHSKKHSYPEKPYELDLDNEHRDRVKEGQLQLFAAQLTAAMSNFNLSKEQG